MAVRDLFLALISVAAAGLLAWHLPDLRLPLLLAPAGLVVAGLVWLEVGKGDFPEPR